MNENFKKKLRDYTEGNLSEDEKRSIDMDLERFEQYQEFLEEQSNISDEMKSEEIFFENKKQTHIIKISKWKARIQNALTAIGIFIIFTFASGTITSVFYNTGDISRMQVYVDVIKSTIAITQPNVMLYSVRSSQGSYFTINIKGDLEKRVGKDNVKVGEADVKFLLGKAGFQGVKLSINKSQKPLFWYPKSSKDSIMDEDWKKLEKLPEGTVAEAHISFDKFYETDEILQKFKDMQVDPLWFAVDTGTKEDPIGFPYNPMWHSDDMILQSKTEEKGILFNKVKTETKSSPSVESYGSGKLRNENFIKTLKLLKKYESIADNVASIPNLNMQKKIDYVNVNGVKIYGMVITGPSKEILKLKQEKWIRGINVGEVQLWNWEN